MLSVSPSPWITKANRLSKQMLVPFSHLCCEHSFWLMVCYRWLTCFSIKTHRYLSIQYMTREKMTLTLTLEKWKANLSLAFWIQQLIHHGLSHLSLDHSAYISWRTTLNQIATCPLKRLNWWVLAKKHTLNTFTKAVTWPKLLTHQAFTQRKT